MQANGYVSVFEKIKQDFIYDTRKMTIYDSEKNIINVLRFFIGFMFVIFFINVLFLYVQNKISISFYLLIPVVLSFFLILYYSFIFTRINRIENIYMLQFFHTTIEVSTISFLFYVLAKAINITAMLISPFPMVYILVISLTGFRQSQKISIYATFLSCVQFLFVHYFLISSVPEAHILAFIDLGFGGTMQKIIYFLLAGTVTAILARHTKKITFNLGDQVNAQAKLINTFGQYVSSEVRDYILKGQFDGTGVLKHGTVLFSDLRNFSSFVENTKASEMFAHLNEYFNEMVIVIGQHGGVVSRFVGDAILAVFGVFDQNNEVNSEVLALEAAIAMQEKLEELNQKWSNTQKAVFRMGVGIDSGTLITGNIGCHDRMEFSCLGRVVNSSMEIEELTKEFGCSILMSDRVYKKSKNSTIIKQFDFQQIVNVNTDNEKLFCLRRKCEHL